jgi:sensor histidine kinase YesM
MSTQLPEVKDATDREFAHPLRVLPWFRNLPDTAWIAFALTALMCLVMGTVFSWVGTVPNSVSAYVDRLGISMSYAFAIGYSIHFISRIFVPKIRIRLRHRPFFVRLIADLAVWTGGAMLGFGIAALILQHSFRQSGYAVYSVIGGTIVISAITGVLLRVLAVQEIEAERKRAERSEAQRTLALSRLRVLQAQIEPHFLFNTLANVSSLIESEPKQARKMLDQFTLLLRASLDQTRKETTPLDTELQVIDAYLSVLKVRMGERLSYQINAPTDLLKVDVPTMFLQPIVENAVKHGIEPRVKGGTVLVDVRREDSQLTFTISDDGVGFVPNTTENVGLGAVRERIAVQFGDRASLTAERTPDHWTRVKISIPMPE